MGNMQYLDPPERPSASDVIRRKCDAVVTALKGVIMWERLKRITLGQWMAIDFGFIVTYVVLWFLVDSSESAFVLIRVLWPIILILALCEWLLWLRNFIRSFRQNPDE